MATSDAYAETARALQSLLESGHDGLAEVHGDLVIAARARDQVLTNLFFAGTYLVGAAEQTVELRTDDMLRHPVRGLTEMLRRIPATGLEGPSPLDLRQDPPTHAAARALAAAAEATERAAHAISGARPEHLTVLPGTSVFDEVAYDPTEGPRTGSQAVAAIVGNHVAWSLTADVSAIAGTVAQLDDNLARQFDVGAQLHGDSRLASAARLLRTSAGDDLRVMAQVVLRMSEAGPLLPAYDLRPATVRAAKVTSVWQIGAALDRTIDLLDAADTLTGPQHRDLATNIAASAHHLAGVVPGPAGKALEALSMQELLFAAQWTNTAIAAVTDGTWQAPTQLAEVSRILAEISPGWLQTSPDAELLGHLTRSARRLPTIASTALRNLRDGFEARDFVVASSDPARRFEPALRTARPRLAIEANAAALADAASIAATALGPSWPRQLPPPSALPRASAVLRETALRTARPNHPAVSPSRQDYRFPQRGRR